MEIDLNGAAECPTVGRGAHRLAPSAEEGGGLVAGRGKSQRSRDLIAAAVAILQRIAPASIRAVCYQLFILKLIANMSKNETNKVGTQLRDARESGQIPWSCIVDETREAETVNAWDDPAAYVETVKRAYRRNRWTDQPRRLEIWSEKGTVRGTVKPILDEYGIPFRVMHGYGSTTTLHDVAVESTASDKPMIAGYVGDWDCSGLNMSESDLPKRIARYGGQIEIVRIALTREQIDLHHLPSFDADTKGPTDESKGDPRYDWFVNRYGQRCWELDALSPVTLRAALDAFIRARLDPAAWRRAATTEAAEIESLSTILNAWPGISRQAPKYSEGAP